MSERYPEPIRDWAILSDLDSLTTRLAEVERERDGAVYAFNKMLHRGDDLFEQLTQAREALERIASMSPSVEQRGWVIAVDIASQALATINREGETE